MINVKIENAEYDLPLSSRARSFITLEGHLKITTFINQGVNADIDKYLKSESIRFNIQFTPIDIERSTKSHQDNWIVSDGYLTLYRSLGNASIFQSAEIDISLWETLLDFVCHSPAHKSIVLFVEDIGWMANNKDSTEISYKTSFSIKNIVITSN